MVHGGSGGKGMLTTGELEYHKGRFYYMGVRPQDPPKPDTTQDFEVIQKMMDQYMRVGMTNHFLEIIERVLYAAGVTNSGAGLKARC